MSFKRQFISLKVKLAWAICFEWKAEVSPVSPLRWVRLTLLHSEGFVSVRFDLLNAGTTGTTTQLSVSGHNLAKV